MIEAYLTLGDGLSLDPFLADAPDTPGPASLLASELARNYSCGRYKNYARERSRMNTIWLNALPSILPSRGEIVLTVTTGLEDLLDAGLECRQRGQLNAIVQDLISAYQRLARTLRRLMPNALIVTTTVPDPTLGEGRMPIYYTPFPSPSVVVFNDLLKEYAARMDGFVVADVYEHLNEPEAWAQPANVQLSSYGCNVIATTWLGEIAKAGLITLKEVA